MRSMRIASAALLALSLLLVACNGEETSLSTTSSIVSSAGGDATTTTAPTSGDGGATTTLVGQDVASYEIAAREPGDDGETLFIVIPAGTYTDVDLENFVGDLVESGTATYGAEVFDDAAAVDAYLKVEADRTDEETALIERHHLVSLVGANTIVFRGPFAESGQHTLGS